MNAIILLATLKRDELSNTQTLSEFLAGRMALRGIDCEIVKLVDHDIPPGTCSSMGDGDGWPDILERILAAQIVIFATPIWWSNHSSLTQRVIERLDELHDRILAGDGSPLDGKVAGIVITGDSDGAQQVIGNICNFCNAIGLLVPPFATLSVLWDRQAKGAAPTKEELLRKYEDQHATTADKMITRLLEHAPR